MENIPGISQPVPPLAPYPPENVRSHMKSSGQWQSFLDLWLMSLEFRLRLSELEFSNFTFSQPTCGLPFIISYLEQYSPKKSGPILASKESMLHRRCYLLLKRLMLSFDIPSDYDPEVLFDLISRASVAFGNLKDWKLTLDTCQRRSSLQFRKAVASYKAVIIKDLSDISGVESATKRLFQANATMILQPEIGALVMAGSDYLETLIVAYNHADELSDASSIKKQLTEHVFHGLRSLMSPTAQNTSLLLDHLYFMKSDADKQNSVSPKKDNLCSSLVCSTSFLRHFAAYLSTIEGTRGEKVLKDLKSYRQQTTYLYPASQTHRRRQPKGKARANISEEMHIHKASQISQIHELFPDISHNYTLKLLDYFNNDVEAVTAALLEPDSLPPQLQQREEDMFDGSEQDAPDTANAIRTVVPERRNVFDDTRFDRSLISSGRLHQGRKDVQVGKRTIDERARSKAAILTALATFDSDDDERDDTYDVADVGGTVDDTLDTDERREGDTLTSQNQSEEILFRAWKSNNEIFARDSKTRISKIRQDLKRETGMSDEQIEGWAIMISRDKSLEGRLERKYAATRSFQGSQGALQRTKWQANASGDDSQDDNGGNSERRHLTSKSGRGFQSSGRGRGGSTAGPSGEAATQAARKRKEQGRGRGGASHGRREGRARKMGRGMGPVAE